jgi:DNA-binding NarL/FixJ family response regulator
METKLRVLLADDHNVVRAGLRALIDAQEDMVVVGEAADGESACRLAMELSPAVTVMDVSMPLMSGASATKEIKRGRPDAKVLALTVHADRSYLHQLLEAGVSGYLLKRAAADDLIHAIRTVARGGVYLDPTLAGKVLTGMTGQAVAPTRLPGDTLSDREEEVMRLIARGYTNREIATQLDVSAKTIETHKARAMEKLRLTSRAGIVAYAIQCGWLMEDDA